MKYCVTRLDGGNLGDLVEPTPEQIKEALEPTGFQPAGDDQFPTTPSDDTSITWIIIIIVICAVAALVIVILAVGKVVHRKR